MQPLISVIVPIYNVKKYLNRCVDSILMQSYRNLEIILVDDGSTDNCGKICDEYAEKDKRVIAIHKKNGGPSSARNAGLDIATGEYIAFVDSDDCINVSYIRILYDAIKSYDADIAVCNEKRIKENAVANIYESVKETETVLYEKYETLSLFEPKNGIVAISPVLKLCKRKLFDGIYFPLGRLCEDAATTYKLFFRASSVVYVHSALYFYTLRSGSIMHDKSLPTEYALMAYDEFLNECNERIEDDFYREKYTNMIVKIKANTILENYYYSYIRKHGENRLNYHKNEYYRLLPELKRRGLHSLPFMVFEFSPKLFVAAVYIYYAIKGKNNA